MISRAEIPTLVSAVVVARNREAVLTRCLRSIRQTGVSDVVVIDGDSTDQTPKIALGEGARVINDGGAGLGAARQLGAEAARHSWVVFVDSDTVLRPDTVHKLMREAQERRLDAIQARLLALPGGTSYWQRGELWRRRMQEPPGHAVAVGCQATLIRRSLLERIQFDRAFAGAGEDGDFFRRANARGARIAFGQQAVAYHRDRASLSEFVRQRIWHGRGLARTVFRYKASYLRNASESSSRLKMPAHQILPYIPFLGISTLALAWGVALETLRLAADSNLRDALRSRRS